MAIAFDAVSEADSVGIQTSLTISHTCTGSDRILCVGIYCRPSGGKSQDLVTGVTYNGVAMTRAVANLNIGLDHAHYFYYIVAPATGVHDVVIDASGGDVGGGTLVAKNTSYTGVKQGAQPDATTAAQIGATPLVASITIVLANCWSILFGDQNGNLSANANCVRRSSASLTRAIFDSNANLAAGSRSMTINGSGGGSISATMMSIAPAVTYTVAVTDTCTQTENALKRARSYPVEIITLTQITIASFADSVGLSEAYFNFKLGWQNLAKTVSSWTNQSKT